MFPDNSCLVGGSSFKDLSSAVYYYTKHKISGVFLYDPTVRSVVNMFSVNNLQPYWSDLLIAPPHNIAVAIAIAILTSQLYDYGEAESLHVYIHHV